MSVISWVQPTTRSTGDLITASIWNTDLVNNLAYLKALSHGGFIASGGSTSSGSGDFTSARNSAGTYTISYNTPYVSWATAVCSASGTAELADIVSSGLSSFQVAFLNLSDIATDTAFSFITMGV